MTKYAQTPIAALADVAHDVLCGGAAFLKRRRCIFATVVNLVSHQACYLRSLTFAHAPPCAAQLESALRESGTVGEAQDYIIHEPGHAIGTEQQHRED